MLLTTCGNNQTRKVSWFKLGLLFDMYMMQNLSLGFTWTLLPILMRQQGMQLGTIGLTALIYSPWAFKFLWAPQIDQHYRHKWGRRKSWIVPLSSFCILFITVLAWLNPSHSLPVIMVVVFLLNLNIATTDIAVDGYATDILNEHERPLGNSLQMTGYILGYMMGSGLFLILYDILGWSTTLLSMVGLHILMLMPVAIHKEIPAIAAACGKKSEVDSRPSLSAFTRIPGVGWLLLFLFMLILTVNAGSQLRLALFVDSGLSPHDLGNLVFWVCSPLSVLGALLCGVILEKFGSLLVFGLGCLGAIAVCILTAMAAVGMGNIQWLAGLILGGEKLVFGLMSVLAYNLMMGVSVGPQAGTNFTVLCSFEHIVMLGGMPIAGALADKTGYAGFYMGLGFMGLLTLIFGSFILSRRISCQHQAPATG